MDQLPEEVASVQNSVAELARSVGLKIGDNTSTATIHVNAGGLGVWIATTCCIVMLVTSIILGVVFMWHEQEQQAQISAHEAEQQRKIDELYNYIAAIYAQAPQLKPKETDK